MKGCRQSSATGEQQVRVIACRCMPVPKVFWHTDYAMDTFFGRWDSSGSIRQSSPEVAAGPDSCHCRSTATTTTPLATGFTSTAAPVSPPPAPPPPPPPLRSPPPATMLWMMKPPCMAKEKSSPESPPPLPQRRRTLRGPGHWGGCGLTEVGKWVSKRTPNEPQDN